MAPRILVLRAAGINCDEETVFAWSRAGARPETMHVKELMGRSSALRDYQLLTIPGGFSYGDDIASGKILANLLNHHLGDAIRGFIERGGFVLGICNGFQVLVRMGLLPGADCGVRLTLCLNDSGRYEDRWVRVRVEATRCQMLDPGDVFFVPVAHGEGKILAEDGEAGAGRLASSGRVALRYVSATGGPPQFPENPNGSIENAAGLTDSTGQVLGLMPHPERNIFPGQTPAGTAAGSIENDGLRFYRRIVERIG